MVGGLTKQGSGWKVLAHHINFNQSGEALKPIWNIRFLWAMLFENVIHRNLKKKKI